MNNVQKQEFFLIETNRIAYPNFIWQHIVVIKRSSRIYEAVDWCSEELGSDGDWCYYLGPLYDDEKQKMLQLGGVFSFKDSGWAVMFRMKGF